jgi:hypothetical protein
MNRTTIRLLAAATALLWAGAAFPQAVERAGRSIPTVTAQLKPGEYVWSPELSPTGTALFIVNLETQRAILFRNGVPIAATTVSTGKTGNDTPTGVFTILQKNKKHYSNLYNNAPMPNMQRLTWDGIALHAGKLPGYPASHGCVRLPMKFSELLFGATKLGMTVIITSIPAVPQNSETPSVIATGAAWGLGPLADAPFQWHPGRSTKGMVSVIVSAADQRAIVLRGGKEIGSAPIRVNGPLNGMVAYALRASDKNGRQWLKLQVAGAGEGMDVSPDEARRFDVPVKFKSAVAAILSPGSVIIVTPESLQAGSPGRSQMVMETDTG